MIRRIWHGWTASSEDADAYQRLLAEEIVPEILQRGIAGLKRVDVLRRLDDAGGETEFVTVLGFDDWAAVEAFADGDGRTSVVPPAARALLSRFDDRSQHYELVASSTGVAGRG